MLPMPFRDGQTDARKPQARLAAGDAAGRRHRSCACAGQGGGEPDRSRRFATEDGLAMPPKKPRLPSTVIADFESWIGQGR